MPSEYGSELAAYYAGMVKAQEPERLVYKTIRDVVPGETGYYGDGYIHEGTKIYRYTGNCYGCGPLPGGMMASMTGAHETPFFEIPKALLALVTEDDAIQP